MGYELNRFICKIDDEFQCSICAMVLEDPVQTPCEHSFCNNCIKDWLSINQTCPVDRKLLTISDLKPPSRPFRNLWNKLDIKCDFEPHGCPASTKLENLVLHVSSCDYNSISKIVCDKGCNMTITRREYHINNCFFHLASAQEKEIMKVRYELRDQKEEFERIKNHLQDDIRKLNDELGRQRSQLRQFQNAMSHEQEQPTELSGTSSVSLRPLKWQWCDNIDEKNILKLDDPTRGGTVISYYRLEPGKSSFKVHILSVEDGNRSCIDLNNKSGVGSLLHYHANGDIYALKSKIYGPRWKVGDIIECEVTFPKNSINNGNYSATVYVSRNKEIIVDKSLTIPKDGIYPYIFICGKDTRLQYFQ